MFVFLLTLAALEAGTVIETDQPSTAIVEKSATWAALRFTGANDAAHRSDETFVIQATMDWPCSGFGCITKTDWRLHFTLQVETKPGRYRVVITNPALSWPPSTNSTAYNGPIRQKKDQQAAADAITAIVDDLTMYIADTDTDW